MDDAGLAWGHGTLSSEKKRVFCRNYETLKYNGCSTVRPCAPQKYKKYISCTMVFFTVAYIRAAYVLGQEGKRLS